MLQYSRERTMNKKLETSSTSAAADAPTDWHALAPDVALQRLDASRNGIADEEAARRRARHGPNALPERKARGPLRRLLDQFGDLLIRVLIGAAIVAALVQHWIDAAVILAVVVVNAVIGFVQEGKAERALQAIRGMLAPKAAVVRQGHRKSIAATELVPGDIIVVEAGDRVPADVRLLEARNVRVDEAALTGESVPVEKSVAPVAASAPLGDRLSMAYLGTLLTSGRATAVVVATGAATEIGRISQLVQEVESLATPLIRQMALFARRLTVAILAFAALLFAFGVLLRGFEATAMFMVVVGLAVAAIPEGLPAILTVTLAIGVQRMAGRNAIIRRLPAVETLGAVSVICSDKTGTLTRNEMTVRTVVTPERSYNVQGVGYDPSGDFLVDGRSVRPDQDLALQAVARGAALCNDSTLRHHDGEWRIEGDPMEAALLALAHKAGLEPAEEANAWPRTDAIPFDAEHRFMATLNHDHAGNAMVYVKGAPERVLQMCDLAQRDAWLARIDEIAAEGQRVLAVACKPADKGMRELRFADVESGLQLLGLLGLIDPPREEAIAAVADCQAAGIRVKMITGDHAATARAIAAQIGLTNTQDVVTGADIDRVDATALRELAPRVDVFARTSPEHKLRLVEALQANGLIVAMTGDGVNDSPALKRADVGIAMGHKGTEAAKEAAEMVLADDNFASIANAVREGRTVYDNLKKAIIFLLPVNGGETLAIIVAVLIGHTLPITPLQILWVNMVSSVGLAMALAFEPTEADAMRRPPRPAAEPVLSAFLLWRVALVSVLFLAGIFGMFRWAIGMDESVEQARTHAVNTLVAMEVFYLFSVRFLRTPSLTWRGALGTPAVLVSITTVTALQFVFTYAPFMQPIFESRNVAFVDGLAIVAMGVVLMVLLEIEKTVRRRFFERPAAGARPAPGH
jgi:magnesium-transporting ATPase (P-type)